MADPDWSADDPESYFQPELARRLKQLDAGIDALAVVGGSVAVGNITGLGTGVATFLATPSSANLAAAVTDELGSSRVVFAAAPAAVGQSLQSSSALAPAWGYPGNGQMLAANATLTGSLADVGAIAFALQPGSYHFVFEGLFTTSGATTLGLSAGFSGTQTLFKQEAAVNTATTTWQSGPGNTTPSTALGFAFSGVTNTRPFRMTGSITVSVAGNLTMQATVSGGVTGTILSGAYARVDACAAV